MDSSPIDSSSEDSFSEESVAVLEAGYWVGSGRYVLKRLLGSGRVGPVWVAGDQQLGEEVVLKFIAGPLASNGSRLQELRQEIGRARKLSFPNVVRVFDLYHLSDEPAFVSMECVQGKSLEEHRLEQPHRVYSWTALQPLLQQACEALEYAHGEGFLHGSLRPSSLILDERGRVRVADFGLAILEHDSLTEEFPPDRFDPRTAFMSPQRLAGDAASVSDDVYALGATAYGLLSGTPPFKWNVGFQVRKVRPQAIGERILESGSAYEVPPLVAAMVMACLAKEPEQRPDSVRVVREGMNEAVARARPPASPSPALPPPGFGQARGEAPEVAGSTLGQSTVREEGLVAKIESGALQTQRVAPATDPMPKTWNPRHAALLRWCASLVLMAGFLIWGWQRRDGWKVKGDPSIKPSTDSSAATQNPPKVPVQISSRRSDEPLMDPRKPTVRVLNGHGDAVNSVAFAPDSKSVASASFDSRVRRWDEATGESLGTLEGHQDRVESVAFSPDGMTLASASRDRTVKLWDTRTGALQTTLHGMNSTVFMVAFSPDGRTLASAEENGEIALWDYATGSQRHRFKAHAGAVWSIAFSPDGRTLASGGVDRNVRLWNATNGGGGRLFAGHTDAVHSVAFSAEGALLASSGRDSTIRLWRASDGRPVRQWSTAGTIGHALAFARRGNGLVSANEDGSVSVWSAATGKLLTNQWGHSGVVHSVAFAPDGRTLASGGHDQTVRLWDWEQLSDSLPDLSDFVELFNGRDLTGWRGDPHYWTVQDGILTGSASAGATVKSFLVWTGEPIRDFELRFVFRSEEGNSGVFFRAQEPQPDRVEGYQYELWSDQTGGLLDVRNSGERRDLALLGQRTVATDSRGTVLVHLVEKLTKPSLMLQTAGDAGWNEGVIIASGNRIVQRLNGLPSAMVLDLDSTRALSQGLIALELYSQGERSRVIQFQRLRLRRF